MVLAAFVVVEMGAESPIFDLRLFRNRAFSVSSAAAVIGMLAFVGACFATSMWLGPVQHQDPIRVALPFLLLQGPAFLLIPVVSRLLHRVAPSWLLSSRFALMAVGCLLCARLDVTDPQIGAFVAPALLIGVGFALIISSVTTVALGSVPPHLAGMTSAATNMLRDLGFALGPVVVGAVALSGAGSAFAPNLSDTVLSAAETATAREIPAAGGPIAVNSVPQGALGIRGQQPGPGRPGQRLQHRVPGVRRDSRRRRGTHRFGMIGLRTGDPAGDGVLSPVSPGRSDRGGELLPAPRVPDPRARRTTGGRNFASFTAAGKPGLRSAQPLLSVSATAAAPAQRRASQRSSWSVRPAVPTRQNERRNGSQPSVATTSELPHHSGTVRRNARSGDVRAGYDTLDVMLCGRRTRPAAVSLPR
ncbi:MFS transporter [Streptomyces sp. PU-14G]|uniref:MFS transporter n=1 Tax=Streptomyces sp. PU-14G TaxID=2800808 RepID=UPI0034DED00D